MTVLAVSERRACRVIGPCRATPHYVPRRLDEEDALRNRVVARAREYGRYGDLRITAVLRDEGGRTTSASSGSGGRRASRCHRSSRSGRGSGSRTAPA